MSCVLKFHFIFITHRTRIITAGSATSCVPFVLSEHPKQYHMLPEDVPLKQTNNASIILAAGKDKIRVSGVLKKFKKFSLNCVVFRWKLQEHDQNYNSRDFPGLCSGYKIVSKYTMKGNQKPAGAQGGTHQHDHSSDTQPIQSPPHSTPSFSHKQGYPNSG